MKKARVMMRPVLAIADWNIYQDIVRLTRPAAGSLTLGILLTILSLVFLLNLALDLLWPALLIVGGLVLLATAFLPE
jgi:hypothetical protein